MTNTCFVIMPIGTQTFNQKIVTADELKKKYGYIIKNAILQADSTLEVIRADEELNPGSMSNDIFTKLMHSKYVLADITYPNPNVFYELGIRHAISPRTILIREKEAEKIPFDISHLRYIEYDQSPGGMEALANELKVRFDFYESHPGKPDNQFLELCAFTNFAPEVYKNSKNAGKEALSKLLPFVLSKPELFQSLAGDSSKEDKTQILIKAISEDPASFVPFIQSLLSALY